MQLFHSPLISYKKTQNDSILYALVILQMAFLRIDHCDICCSTKSLNISSYLSRTLTLMIATPF